MSGPRVLIVGVGNDYRGDDAAGLAVAREIAGAAPRGVDVIEATGEGGRLVDAWSGYEAVVLIDAMRSGLAPGSLRRLDVTAGPVPAYFSHRSTHAVGVLDAVEIARAMGRLPSRVALYGVEGASYEAGPELSGEVERALPAAVEAVRHEAEEMMAALEANARA